MLHMALDPGNAGFIGADIFAVAFGNLPLIIIFVVMLTDARTTIKVTQFDYFDESLYNR